MTVIPVKLPVFMTLWRVLSRKVRGCNSFFILAKPPPGVVEKFSTLNIARGTAKMILEIKETPFAF